MPCWEKLRTPITRPTAHAAGPQWLEAGQVRHRMGMPMPNWLIINTRLGRLWNIARAPLRQFTWVGSITVVLRPSVTTAFRAGNLVGLGGRLSA